MSFNAPPITASLAAPNADTRRMPSVPLLALTLIAALSTSACSSLFHEGASTAAGIGGAAIASQVTTNATVASGIGLGVLAAAEAGVKHVERRYHRNQQDRIAQVAGGLSVGQVAQWESYHRLEIEPNVRGRVTVNREMGSGALMCKEIVFSVDDVKDEVPRSGFYVATICRDVNAWKWASAEPATQRWGALQ
jgi:hypothetical protein